MEQEGAVARRADGDGGRCGDHHRLGSGLPLEGGFLAVGFDMPLGVIDEEAAALLTGLNGIIEGDRYPVSPQIRVLRGIRAKFPTATGTPSATRPLTPEGRDPGHVRQGGVNRGGV